MREFVIRDGYVNTKLMVVAESRYAASMALLKYLTNRGHQVCVLKHGFLKYHYIVIGNQTYFKTWLKEAEDRARHEDSPVIEYVDSLESEAVSKWAEDILKDEVWTYYVSGEFDDEYTRSGPSLRCYRVGLAHFAGVSEDQEDDPELKPFKNGGYLAAYTIKEEQIGVMEKKWP